MDGSPEQPGSLKERLRLKALEAQEKQRLHEQTSAESERYYRDHLHRIMVSAAAYFDEIVKSLQAIDETATVRFPIGSPRSPDVLFLQDHYRMHVDDADYPRTISVVCRCELKHPFKRSLFTKREADEYELMLRQMGINFHRRRQDDLRGAKEETSEFTVEGEVWAGVTLKANPSNKSIDLRTENLEDLPSRRHVLEPGRFDDAFLERLGSLLVRESKTLIASEVDPKVRIRFQAATEARERSRARAMADAEEQARRELESQFHRKVMRKAQSTLTTGVEKGKDILKRKVLKKGPPNE